ncbi:aldolase/citrate lyase family protein [Streptomyces sp. NPDC002076]
MSNPDPGDKENARDNGRRMARPRQPGRRTRRSARNPVVRGGPGTSAPPRQCPHGAQGRGSGRPRGDRRPCGRALPLNPLVETALDIERAPEVCAAPGVVRAAFGNVDLAARRGVAHDDHDALAHARARLVLASAAAGAHPPRPRYDGTAGHGGGVRRGAPRTI